MLITESYPQYVDEPLHNGTLGTEESGRCREV